VTIAAGTLFASAYPISQVKAYIRKANILHTMRDYSKALEAIQEASDHDTEHQHTKEISQTELKIQQGLFTQHASESQEETLQRAMRDPEVAVCVILLDPWVA
jgi:stress-induced-phosphoprotein 1